MSLSNRVKIFLQVTFVIAVFGAGIRVADIGDSATMLGRGFGLDEVKVGAPGEFGEGEFGIADAIAQAVPVRALSADEIRELTGSWSWHGLSPLILATPFHRCRSWPILLIAVTTQASAVPRWSISSNESPNSIASKIGCFLLARSSFWRRGR